MTGGQLQLVAYGAQDIILTGNPMITYFKVVYRRHTNFAMYSAEQNFTSVPYFGREVSCLLSNQGDLVAGLYLQVQLPDLVVEVNQHTRWIDDIGHHLVDWIDINISGQHIDRQYGDWLEIWSQLTLPMGQDKGYRESIGQDPKGPLGISMGLQRPVTNAVLPGRMIYIPAQFWFCRNIGLALPLIALQYSEVRVTLKLKDSDQLIISYNNEGEIIPSTRPSTSVVNATLWVDYVLLDTEERRRFAQVPHEYLIEQLQVTPDLRVPGDTFNNRTVTVDLTFHHPVKELVWVCRYNEGQKQWSNYSDRSDIIDIHSGFSPGIDLSRLVTLSSVGRKNPVVEASLYLNGNLRSATQPGFFYNRYVPLNTHTRTPSSPGINVYSFALKPETHQPSGSCNFSRLHDAKLVLTLAPGTNHVLELADLVMSRFRGSDATVKVYAVNYNIFRVMGGMGGIAYRQ